MKPLTCDIPYPSTENLQKDVRSGQILSFAYATLQGELAATLQYVFHETMMKPFNEQHSQTLLSIALAEMKHVNILAEAMSKLGVTPIYVQYPNSKAFFNSSCVSRSVSPTKMIMDDIAGELNAIAEYKKMLFALKNDDVSAIVQRLILDEELHLETLKQMLQCYSSATDTDC